MKTTSLLSLHEKATKTLEAIEKCKARIEYNKKDLEASKDAPWILYTGGFYKERIEINTRLVSRLESIYANLLTKINKMSCHEND